MISPYYVKILMHSLLPLLCGAMIYALVRGIPLIDSTHNIFPLFSEKGTPAWICYNLPDGLWCYAFLSTIFIIWKEPSVSRFLWLCLAIVIAFSSEVLQAYNFIDGTFDWNDLIAYTVASAAFCLNFQGSGKIPFVHN